jgi:hypothetical protein
MLKRTLLFVLLIGCISMSHSQDTFSKIVKVALRDSGNKLLLHSNDSTSLVLPVIKFDKNKYELSFEKEISIEPDSLVNSILRSFEIANISRNYIVEVINCSTKEVVYSYQIKGNKEEDIIPCLGRNLPLNCYKIAVVFTHKKQAAFSFIGYIILATLIIGFFLFLVKNKKTKAKNPAKDIDYTIFGNYKFYEDQNKIIIDGLELKLTTKESQILKIFIQNQNVIIKREQLIKEVWEDNGVVVGRSLDAFISKIRKKFENDSSINIINIHGVGYKLEVID